MNNTELYHHGIDGQRWGIKHGPPYPLSRKESRAIKKREKMRKKNLEKMQKIRRESRAATKERHTSYKKAGKAAKKMTNADLNATIERLQREETYRRLVSREKEEKAATKAAKKLLNQQKQEAKDAQKKQKNQNEKKDSWVKQTGKNVLTVAINSYTKALIDGWVAKKFPKQPGLKWTKHSDGRWSVQGDEKSMNILKDIFQKFETPVDDIEAKEKRLAELEKKIENG